MLRDYCAFFASDALIVVVANGCTDDTCGVVRALQDQFSNLRLVEISGRIGKGGAVRVGLATASEPYVGFADADGSTSAEEFSRLYRHCTIGSTEAVVGSRWLPCARVEPRQPRARRIASRAFNTMVRLLFSLPFSDTQCGAKVFRRTALGEILKSLEAADFAFDIEILWRLIRRGYRVLEVPTTWSDRSSSRVSLLPAATRMLATVLRMRLSESLVWKLPYCDRFGQKTTIPVKSSPHVLLLGESARYGDLIEALERSGARVTRDREALPGSFLFFKAAFLFWYVLRSSRQYDAIVELAGGLPALIPAFSIKPTFLIDRRARLRDARALMARLLYRRTRVITADPSRAQDVALAILESAEAHGRHAVFYHVGEDVEIAYEDAVSGRRVRQRLTE